MHFRADVIDIRLDRNYYAESSRLTTGLLNKVAGCKQWLKLWAMHTALVFSLFTLLFILSIWQLK